VALLGRRLIAGLSAAVLGMVAMVAQARWLRWLIVRAWPGCGGVRAGREAPGARGPIAGSCPRGGAALEAVRKVLTREPSATVLLEAVRKVLTREPSATVLLARAHAPQPCTRVMCAPWAAFGALGSHSGRRGHLGAM
jgi:hypothetical protein